MIDATGDSPSRERYAEAEYASRLSHVLGLMDERELAFEAKQRSCAIDGDPLPQPLTPSDFEFLGIADASVLFRRLYVYATLKQDACSEDERAALALAAGMARYLSDRAPDRLQRSVLSARLSEYDFVLYGRDLGPSHDDVLWAESLSSSARDRIDALMGERPSPSAVLESAFDMD